MGFATNGNWPTPIYTICIYIYEMVRSQIIRPDLLRMIYVSRKFLLVRHGLSGLMKSIA